MKLYIRCSESKSKIEPGMIVRYDPKWCTPAERRYLHVVKERRLNPVTNEETRFLIETLNSNLFFNPTETVDEEMLEPTGFTVDDFDSVDDIINNV
jgi:hypothetical protein